MHLGAGELFLHPSGAVTVSEAALAAQFREPVRLRAEILELIIAPLYIPQDIF